MNACSTDCSLRCLVIIPKANVTIDAIWWSASFIVEWMLAQRIDQLHICKWVLAPGDTLVYWPSCHYPHLGMSLPVWTFLPHSTFINTRSSRHWISRHIPLRCSECSLGHCSCRHFSHSDFSMPVRTFHFPPYYMNHKLAPILVCTKHLHNITSSSGTAGERTLKNKKESHAIYWIWIFITNKLAPIKIPLRSDSKRRTEKNRSKWYLYITLRHKRWRQYFAQNFLK